MMVINGIVSLADGVSQTLAPHTSAGGGIPTYGRKKLIETESGSGGHGAGSHPKSSFFPKM
jgi:hypothetical protein